MTQRRLVAAAVVVGAMALVGALVGVLWWTLAPRPDVTVTSEGATVPYPVSETTFASEGYFALMATAVGLVSGYTVYALQYRLAATFRGADVRLFFLFCLVVGAFLGSVVAWRVGVLLDAEGFQRARDAAQPGDVITAGLRLHALSALLTWPFVGVLQYAVFDAVSMWRRDLPYMRCAGGQPDSADPGSARAAGPDGDVPR
ncbi:hypothetical protein [Haloactinospora alba]|uniref:hypothetical protein n=1 Tax=Haloactinospora alba TaxID=405555 RepID=UPI001FEA2AE8|nr:hypothetical protein [Haloactinospora alba]